MTTSQTFDDGDIREASVTRLRSLLLPALVLSVLLAGGWGVFTSVLAGPAPARVGEAVETPGGLIRVEEVTPEHMAPMQAGKFAASGMSMSSMGMDMAPEGYRRIAVSLSLAGEEGGLDYAPDDFRVSGDGADGIAPIRTQLDPGTVPAGAAISGSMVFEVPEEAEALTISFRGSRLVALDLPSAGKNGGHGH